MTKITLKKKKRRRNKLLNVSKAVSSTCYNSFMQLVF